jgi:hypothetical protein
LNEHAKRRNANGGNETCRGHPATDHRFSGGIFLIDAAKAAWADGLTG